MTDVEKLSDVLYRITVPTPFPVGPVNVYFVDAGEPAIIDTGAQTDEAWAALNEAFRELGRDLKDIRRIVITHGHMDHFGMTRRILDVSRARVEVHADDAACVADYVAWVESRADEVRQVAMEWGVAPEALGVFKEYHAWMSRLTQPVPADRLRPIEGRGGELRLGDLALQVIHCPGHARGQICLYDAVSKRMFVGDHVLQRITPIAGLYAPSYRGQRTGLLHYLESLRAIEGFDVKQVLPGHGVPYAGLRARIAQIRRHHTRRAQRVVELLGEGQETVLEVAQGLWRRLGKHEWLLAMIEVHGHLIWLELQEKVVRSVKDGVARFRAR